MKKIPELLMPAGNFDKLEIAYLYGADAVYCGVPRFSLRARENEFTMEILEQAIKTARSLGKKIYFTVNAIPRNSKIPSYSKYLKEMAVLKPDGFIMADPGLIMITREETPEINVHISVQANTMNYATVKFWQKIGATRVILSREVSIEEIKKIREEIPEIELEVFVHGAICIAHSGRCLMSNYFKNRDANQGACNNACRDKLQVYVTNPRQNNELMLMEEDEDDGTFLMNSKDLRAIEFLDEIIDAGVDSIKVEGRTKNDYYVALVARSYRKALDNIKENKEFDRNLLKELDKVASRGYFSGFLTRGMEDRVSAEEREFQNYKEGLSRIQSQVYVGRVKNYNPTESLITIEVKNKIKTGDLLEVYSPNKESTDTFYVTDIIYKNQPKDVISGGMGDVSLKVPYEIPENSFLSLI